MNGYVKRIAIGSIVGLLLVGVLAATGCTYFRLASDATPAEKAAALCKDAQLGLAWADLAATGNPTGDLAAYWQTYRAGAFLAFQTYCPKGASQ